MSPGQYVHALHIQSHSTQVLLHPSTTQTNKDTKAKWSSRWFTRSPRPHPPFPPPSEYSSHGTLWYDLSFLCCFLPSVCLSCPYLFFLCYWIRRLSLLFSWSVCLLPACLSVCLPVRLSPSSLLLHIHGLHVMQKKKSRENKKRWRE